jgi:trigger factor
MVRLDFSASVNGKPAPGLEGKGRLIEMGRESIFPGLQDRLLGAKRGGVTEFVLPFPEGPESQEEKEKPPTRMAHFHVVVQELLRKEVPQLDDEFAKDHGECDTLEELRGKVRQNLQLSLDRQDESRLEDAILSQLVTRNPFEVPPSLVREQERRMLVDAGLLRPDEDLASSRLALPEQFREEFSARARQQVQSFLVLEALANQQNIQVAEEEVQQRIADIVAANGVERRQQIEALYERPENRQSLEHRLQQEKTLRFVIEKAQVKTVEQGDSAGGTGVAGGEEKD